MGGDGEGEGELKSIPRPFSSLEWSHEAEEQTKSPTGVRFKGAQRPKWRPPAADGSPGGGKDGAADKQREMKSLTDNVFSSTKKTKQTEKTVPLAMHDALKREKDQLAMQLKALAEKYEGAKKRVATLEEDLFASTDICKKYEGMYVIPLNEDLDALTRSISEIDKDIKKYDTAIVGEDEGSKRPAPLHLPDSVSGKAQVLLETKVQRMEHLVFTLKKRINKYENCVDDRSDTAKFDSKEYLRKENLRLSKEVKRLMTAEMSFKTESLLDKKCLTTYDPMLFDVLISALQDDLRAHRTILEKYSFEKNSGLEYLTTSPAPLAALDDLPNLLEEWGQEEAVAATPVPVVPDVDTLEHENRMMKEQVKKLEMGYEMLNEQLEMERECNGSEGKKLTGKARKIELLMETNKENLKRISDANAELRKKDEIVTMQEALTHKIVREKEQLMNDCQAVNAILGKATVRNKELRNAVVLASQAHRKEADKNHGLYTLVVALIGAVCLKANVDDHSLKSTVPVDFMEVFMKQAWAATVIQSAGRGMRGRMKLVERFGREKITAWKDRQALDFATVKPSAAQTRVPADYVAMGLSEEQAEKLAAIQSRAPPEKDPKPSLDLANFPATRALAQMIKFSEKDHSRWIHLPQLMRIVKAEVREQLKGEVEQDMRLMKEDMIRMGTQLLRQATVNQKETRPQAVQVGCTITAETEMQTDEEPPAPDGKKK